VSLGRLWRRGVDVDVAFDAVRGSRCGTAIADGIGVGIQS
jgi:hypothetical protein